TRPELPEAVCTQAAILPSSGEIRWVHSGLDLNADWVIECGDITAYKLQSFGGGWSDWYVLGVNDGNGLRRNAHIPTLFVN
ncbi:unnamed protein product, partial [Didymodactylos carnosus]